MNVKRRLADIALVVLLGGLLTAELAVGRTQPAETVTTWWAYLWVPVIVLPIAVHRRWPAWAALISAGGIVGYSLGHFVAYPGYAAITLVFLISLHTARGRGLLAFAALAVGIGIALALQSSVTVTASTWISTMLALAVAWLAGENLRIRQDRWAAMRERAEQLEAGREERARRAVTAERLRIARELHDVVAHSMSVIAVQAGVAHHLLDSRPELARDALATVETGARSALVEMRRLLGVLRHEGEAAASLAPAPTLAEVPELVERFRAAGLTVTAVGDGAAGEVPEGVELSAYRIVQEGLTNVLRHGGPHAELRIDHGPGLVRLEISDDGRPAGASTSGGGHGLVGMRERVAVFGGAFTAGPRPGGGFVVTATLPYAEAVAMPGIPMAADA